MKLFKMGVFNNIQRFKTFDIKEYMKNFQRQIQTGFKLDKNNNYDMQQKRLANTGEGVDESDAITKHQMETGLATKSDQTSVLLSDGKNHMTGDLDLRGNKIILPGGIDMNRKLITNLGTDPNQDLSAVNMVTLKNNVRLKADKNYVDGEITKLVKKTGDVLSGDLILPHDSYPVQGNTNKAVSYETQREIFLSRKESFPMQADINMNNNFIQNVATPMTSHQGANKGYCDYNFLNRQEGGRIMGSLSMNQNDLFEIPALKYGSSAVNKNYVDGKLGASGSGGLPLTGGTMKGFINMNNYQITNLDFPSSPRDAANKQYVDNQAGDCLQKSGGTMTGKINMGLNKITNLATPDFLNDAANKLFVDTKLSKSGGQMTGAINMNNHNIINLADPTQTTEATNKRYVDNQLLNSHLLPSHRENAFKYLLDQDESSSEQKIIVNGIVDFPESPHKNKKAYSVDMVYLYPGHHEYVSKIGINIYPLPLGKYTIIMEYYFPENTGIFVGCEASSHVVINKQTSKNFPDYEKLLVQFDQRTKDTPDYLYFTIRGAATTSTNPEGYLIFYGIKGWADSVPPEIYDHALESSMFEFDDG